MASNTDIVWNEDTTESMRQRFEEVAENGTLNAKQLEECLLITGLEPTTYKLKWLIKHFDKNGNGKLEVEELLENLPTLHAYSVKEPELTDAFKKFDTNNDGNIRLTELKQILCGGIMSPIEAEKLLTEWVNDFDINHDGKFNYAGNLHDLVCMEYNASPEYMFIVHSKYAGFKSALFPKEEILKYMDFRQCFEEVAENGSIDADQLQECLHIAGLDTTMFELDWMIRHFDKNKNGKLEVEELMENLPTLYAHSVREDDLINAFQCFDIDGDGYIRLPELKKVLTANNFMTGEEAGKLINDLVIEFDSDHDGKFDYGEFMDIFLSDKYSAMDKDSESSNQKMKKKQ